MADCWICVHRRQPPKHAVGCCIHCHVHACDGDGDRLLTSEFWCHICLGNATVDSAGFVAYRTQPSTRPRRVERRDLPPWLPDKVGADLLSTSAWTDAQVEHLADRGVTVDPGLL